MRLQEWARDPENVPILQRIKQIVSVWHAHRGTCVDRHTQVFGGAPMNKTIGDELAKAGVRLTPGYGM